MHSHGSEFQSCKRMYSESLLSIPDLVPSFANFVCIHLKNILHKQMYMSIHFLLWFYKYNFKKYFYLKKHTTIYSIPCCFHLKNILGTSLVVQWLRIHLPMQRTQVWALVQEDPTCHGVAKPMCRNYWACALEPASHSYWARVPQLLKPTHLEPVLCNKRSHLNEKPTHHNRV